MSEEKVESVFAITEGREKVECVFAIAEGWERNLFLVRPLPQTYKIPCVTKFGICSGVYLEFELMPYNRGRPYYLLCKRQSDALFGLSDPDDPADPPDPSEKTEMVAPTEGKMAGLLMNPRTYNELIGCAEFLDRVISVNVDGKIWFGIYLPKIPRTHYLPVGGNYVKGWKLLRHLNRAIEREMDVLYLKSSHYVREGVYEWSDSLT